MAFRNIMTGYIGTMVSLSYPFWMKQIFLYHWHTDSEKCYFKICFHFFFILPHCLFFCFNRREKQKSELSGHKPCYRTWRKSYFTWEHSDIRASGVSSYRTNGSPLSQTGNHVFLNIYTWGLNLVSAQQNQLFNASIGKILWRWEPKPDLVADLAFILRSRETGSEWGIISLNLTLGLTSSKVSRFRKCGRW